jgi:hypothetical protein
MYDTRLVQSPAVNKPLWEKIANIVPHYQQTFGIDGVIVGYRIVARNSKTGNMDILAAGTAEGKGLANSAEDAAANGLKDLVENLTPKILDKMAQYIQGNVKKVRIKVNGVTNMETNMEVKSILQNIVWVSGVEEAQMGEFTVGYPENSVYLANSIKQKGNFTVENFTPYSITFIYQK